MKRFALLTLIAAASAQILVSCAGSSAKLPVIAKGTALFDNFSYKGNDAFYRNNPLPSDDSFYTPILPGWYSDPSICTNGQGDYFLVTSTFVYFPGVPIFHSRDLVNWKQVGHVLTRPSQLVNMQRQHVSGGIFAPAISYNPHNQTYYMVTTNVGAGNFYVKTQDPFGEWSDPIMLPEVGGIDPSFFFDEDGKAYIVNNDEAPDFKAEYDGHRTIRVQEFDWKNDKTVGPRKILVNKGANPAENPIWIEGPHMYKINGKYYLMDAEGGTGTMHSEVIFRADSPMGPFKPWKNNPILTQRHLDPNRDYPITCAGHADLVQTQEGDWWAVFLACRPIDNKFENLGRETFLLPVTWTEDGYPSITEGDEVIPMIQKREGVKRDAQVTFGNFEDVEEFDQPELGYQWHTLRAPATELYSLTQTPGYLALKCADVAASERATPALVARRMQHHEFEAETRMLFNPEAEAEKAGLILFKDERHHYFFAFGKKGEDKTISLLQNEGRQGMKELASQVLPADTKVLNLKVVSTGETYAFLYSINDGKKWEELIKGLDAEFLSTARCGGFTGTVIGPYATIK
ncbi:MAG: glycoside hydrolase family 43 protein [Mediterranea massiliensis]|nr:glycoside hydrolase family 43 protein [Mediterranea massiliensis]